MIVVLNCVLLVFLITYYMCIVFARISRVRNANIVRIVDDDVIVMSYVCTQSLMASPDVTESVAL